MNKIVFRGLFFTIAVILLIVVLPKRISPFGKSNSSFSSEPKKEITKIEFSEKGRKLSLEKKGADWLLNGNIETRKNSILFILRILQEIEIKSTVSAELFETVITAKEIVPVEVRVYEKRRLLNSFLVYKTQSNIYGNIMKKREGSKPFIVYVPGFEGDIGSGFILNELFWQPYTVFNLLPSEIESVEFENLSDSSSSFSIINQNNHFILFAVKGTLTGWDSTLVNRYISYFTWIPFESWAFEIGEEEKKKVESQQPLYKITVCNTVGKKTVLTLWERSINENGTYSNDSDRLLGKTEKSHEFFIMRYFDIDPLLKKRSYFFTQ